MNILIKAIVIKSQDTSLSSDRFDNFAIFQNLF